jgi:hypothetical protein
MLEVLQPFKGDFNGALDEARWAAVRRPERACDHALNGTSRLWLRKLPARRRPLRLCIDHPRVANRIAWCWHDVELSSQLLDDLLQDRRGGRRGFGATIHRELKRLQEFNALQRVESRPEGLWQAVARHVGVG